MSASTTQPNSAAYDPRTGSSPRTLVLLFDGSNNQFNEKNTNLPKLQALLERDLPGQQLIYYQTGIGTYTDPAILSRLGQEIAKVVDLAVAWYLDAHIKQGYTYLMSTYRPGDRICIFGFSRGAYIGRALAGMLKRVGLLTYGNLEQVEFAYKMYKSTDDRSTVLAEKFKSTFCLPVVVDFVGCWDTVASVGVIMPRTLPYVTDNEIVRHFRHCLSIDEHRVLFSELMWNNGFPPSVPPPDDNDGVAAPGLDAAFSGKGDGGRAERELERSAEWKAARTIAGKGWIGKQRRFCTDAKEVWFPGFHSDVGGGELLNTAPHGLDRLTLIWMVRECISARVGLLFSRDALRASGIDAALSSSPIPRAPEPQAINHGGSEDLYKPKEGRDTEGTTATDGSEWLGDGKPGGDEGYPDLKLDATAKAHDSLATFGIKLAWWILEVLPIPRSYYVLDKEGKQVRKTHWLPHLGRGRKLPDDAKLSIGVKVRQEEVKGYKPKGRVPKDATFVW